MKYGLRNWKNIDKINKITPVEKKLNKVKIKRRGEYPLFFVIPENSLSERNLLTMSIEEVYWAHIESAIEKINSKYPHGI